MKRFLLAIGLVILLTLALVSCGGECEHTFGAWEVLSQPTCAVCGVRTHVCTKCGEVRSEEIARLTDHVYGAWETEKTPTCKEGGKRVRACQICAVTETESLVQTETHVCSTCGKAEKRQTELLTAHTYTLWEETLHPTCKSEGLKNRTCTVCGKTEEKSVAKLNTHAFGETTVLTEASYFKDGSGTHTCADCGLTESVAIPKTGSTVYVFEDYSDTPAIISDNENNAMIRGIDYSTVGKQSKMLTVTEGGNSYLCYDSTVNGLDTILNMSMKGIFGENSGKTLANLCVDGKITFSFRIKCNYPTNEYAAFSLRLRGPGGASDTVEFFRVKWDGKVLCGGLQIGKLTTEFQTFTVTIDFGAGKLYGYTDGVLKGSDNIAAPNGNFTTWLSSVDTYVFNGSFTQANNYDKIVYIDDVIFMGGGYVDEICPKND